MSSPPTEEKGVFLEEKTKQVTGALPRDMKRTLLKSYVKAST
jgi:hypothetical protein